MNSCGDLCSPILLHPSLEVSQQKFCERMQRLVEMVRHRWMCNFFCGCPSWAVCPQELQFELADFAGRRMLCGFLLDPCEFPEISICSGCIAQGNAIYGAVRLKFSVSLYLQWLSWILSFVLFGLTDWDQRGCLTADSRLCLCCACVSLALCCVVVVWFGWLVLFVGSVRLCGCQAHLAMASPLFIASISPGLRESLLAVPTNIFFANFEFHSWSPGHPLPTKTIYQGWWSRKVRTEQARSM